ncbi:MAG: hypothetical protein COV72_05260 [Candidatus Omnitrophica bacterium CG11_big_fil_rev_8_21_14_0_20_42_13]|uniref:Uncharacterized protein n=1 Tax=Candidatus Ghiorseimicrobium undicola TaxID=1974746 RepID=A0A2H0LXD1_9BACT|nr:MAG: hypothetical protein COV72_05260 [Candidatus Omnitrophica bacterium CG11_big_fil_rev_8_21_14_0_20_42_13]
MSWLNAGRLNIAVMEQKINKPENLDFEIRFYEKLLKDSPNFITALIALGDNYTKSGRYEDGLKVDLKLSQMKPGDPVIHYNLACSYSLLKMADECISALKKAIELGYSDFDFMKADPDLNFIHLDPRFKSLLLKTDSNVI